MTSSSQRLVDLHRLSSLDEVAKPNWANGINGVSGHSRGGTESNQRTTATYPMNPPAAPEVPRGPPHSYRNTSAPENALPQRSFSQRAKGRPFAEEAFTENGQMEDYNTNGIASSLEDPSDVYDGDLAPTNRQATTKPLHVNTDVRRDKSARQTSGSHLPAMQSPRLTQNPKSQLRDARRASETIPRAVEPTSPPERSSTLQYPPNMTEEQRREWAPDRSPLQKLEVKLNDISKEEKRARVEEAEMLLRESKAGRGGRRPARDAMAPVAQPLARQGAVNDSMDPTHIEEAGLRRGLSGGQHDRLHHSAKADSRNPDVRHLSGEERRGSNSQEQEYNRDRARLDGDRSTASPRQIQSRRRFENSKTLPVQDQSIPQRNNENDGLSSADSGLPPREQRGLRQSGGSMRDQTTSDQIKQSAQYVMSTRSKNQPSRDRRSLPANANYHSEGGAPRDAAFVPAIDAQPGPRTVAANPTRALSLHKALPPYPDEEDVQRSGAMREANSSHKAALASIAGAGIAPLATAGVNRTESRKLQKTPAKGRGSPREEHDWEKLADSARQRRETAPRPDPVDPMQAQRGASSDRRPENTKVEVFQKGVAKQVDVSRNPSQRGAEPIGLGLHGAPAVPTASHQHQHPHHLSEVLHHKPRRQSVSFKEPLGPGQRPEEWREAGVARLSLADLALDSPVAENKDKAWWESQDEQTGRKKSRRSSGTRTGLEPQSDPIDDRYIEFKPPLYLRCGPLLRYTGMKSDRPDQTGATQSVEGHRTVTGGRETWRGSVLIVTQDSQSSYESVPTLRLFSQPKDLLPPPPEQVQELAPEYVDPIAGLTKISRTGKMLYVRPVDHLDEGRDLSQVEDDNGLFESSPSPLDTSDGRNTNTATSNRRTRGRDGEALGKFQEVKGARLYADPIRDVTFWRFNIEVELGEHQAHIAYRINRGPATGFWVPARGQSMNIMFHSCNGFSLSVNPDLFSGPDPLWRDVLNTHQTRPFHVMIGGGDQIYNDRVMLQTQHFGGWTQIKNPHEKHNAPFTHETREELESFYLQRYAMWFSQGLFSLANSQIPMVNMWDDHDIIDGFGSYPDHFMRSPVFSGLGHIAFKYYMLFQHHSVVEETVKDEPSWLLGAEPGPYIKHHSRSLFMQMGKHVAFLGLDCRTERQRDEVLTDKTYDLVLERCRKEIIEGETKHLIVLLGIPIAYPRLVWLENVFTSRAMDPIKALGRAGILKGGLLNKFDGGVELLDDLDDHWTAKKHKHERNDLILDLQDLSAEKSVRITILGGDVHLAAIGQFYSNPKLRVPKDKDHRYMPNIISSAIVNTPPPDMMADILNKRNRVHELNKYTAEDMIPMFTHDVDGRRRNNKCLLPRRNWCSIREYHPGSTPPPTPPESPSASESETENSSNGRPQRRFSFSREDVNPRNLFRRISSRGAPPSSYREDMEYGQVQRPASYDGSRPPRSFNPLTQRSASSTPQRTSFDPNAPPQAQGQGQPSNRRASFEQLPSTLANGPPVRPGNFQRRPTNLSEKAARKGVVPGLDKEGNEVEVNEHINLEGGLDIIINCEVSQKDSAGITTPYRLLVPALWYDGSSDREKLDGPLAEVAAIARKPTLLKRIGLGGKRRGANVADEQADGNWDQEMSGTESYSGSESAEEHEPRPRRTFSLFRRRRANEREPGEPEASHGAAVNRHQQMHEDYARASQQAKVGSMPGVGPGFQDQHTQQPVYPTLSPPSREGIVAARGSGSQDQFRYAGGLPPARQLQGSTPPGNGPPRGPAHDNDTRLDAPTRTFRRQPAGSGRQHNSPGVPADSPSLNGASPNGQDHNQYSDRQSQAVTPNVGPPPQNSSKVARLLGEQPQHSGPPGFGRAQSAGHNNPGPNNPHLARSQSQRVQQTYYPPPSGFSAGSTQPYFPPPPRADIHAGQGDGYQQYSDNDDRPRGYGGIESYKEPKKRRWSFASGKKWIGDGRIPDA